jgi:hypothetical protein
MVKSVSKRAEQIDIIYMKFLEAKLEKNKGKKEKHKNYKIKRKLTISNKVNSKR